MRRKAFIVALLVCLAAVQTPAQQRRGLKVVVSDPLTGQSVDLYRDSWALLIGINKYQNVNQLDYAGADARSVGALLHDRFGFSDEKIITLIDGEATKEKIINSFAKLLDTDPQDRLVVFYAGHGMQFATASGGEAGYIVPVDGVVTTPSDAYRTCISMEEIRNLATQIPAKHILFLMDACYGGLAAVSSRALKLETQQYLEKNSSLRARQIITAGGKGEQVIEKAEWGHSAFTYKLLEGLDKGLADGNGDFLVTASELYAYLRSAVSAASGNRQTPVFKSFSDDEGDFVFVIGVPKYSVTVSSVPPQASVSVDGEDKGVTPLTVDIERGEHEIQITRTGYQPYRQKLNVTGITTINPQLTEDVFELAVTSNPSGGMVYVNGVERGTTSLVMKLKPGHYSLDIEHEGYKSWKQDVDVTSNQSVTASMLSLKDIAAAPKPEEKPAETPKVPVTAVSGGGSTLWWIIGGAAVVGGGAALLLSKGKKEETPGPSASKLPDPPVFPFLRRN